MWNCTTPTTGPPKALPGATPPDAAGPGGIRPDGGHGLLGMRERAAAVGGELSTGEAVGGGFLVHATLPGKGEAG
jgi:hypothetical protein